MYKDNYFYNLQQFEFKITITINYNFNKYNFNNLQKNVLSRITN